MIFIYAFGYLNIIMRIESISARVVYNNRLEEAVEVEINEKYKGISPSGASKGSHEVKYIPARLAVKRINKISEKYIGEKLIFEKIDREIKFLKEKIGGNGSIAFSYALFNANFEVKDDEKYYFPLPLSNVIGGGMHNGNMNIQEILVSPSKAKTFKEAFEINRKIYEELKKILKKKKSFLGYNDESAIISKLNDIESLNLVSRIVDKYDAYIGVDFASNSYYNTKTKKYEFLGKKLSTERYYDEIMNLIKEYNLKYAEDPFYEDDFERFSQLREDLKRSCYVVGDDLTTTNPKRLSLAIKERAISGIIVKPNQIGTISESIEVKEMAEKNDILPVISHRSGESDDNTISRVSIKYRFKLAKIGIAGIRIVKINELIRLWDKVYKKKVENPWKKLKR